MPATLVTTLRMFRQVMGHKLASFDIVFIDDCQNLSVNDWHLVDKLKAPIVAFTSMHPLTLSSRISAFFEKRAPDYSYGISSVRLRDIAEIQVGASYASSELLKEGKWKFVRPRDIKNGAVEINTYISTDAAKKKVNKALRIGDIVVQNIFSFGKMAIIRRKNLPAIASQNLFVIRSKTIAPEILFEYLHSKVVVEAFRKQMGELSHGAPIRHISVRDVGEIPVPLPFSKKQIAEFGSLKRLKDAKDLEKARNELVHLREAYKQFSESEE